MFGWRNALKVLLTKNTIMLNGVNTCRVFTTVTGFYNCQCNSMFDLSKAYIAVRQFHLFGDNSPIARATSKAVV